MNSLRVHIFPCENSTYNDFQCESNEVIDYYLNYHIFLVFFQDTLLTPLDFESPAKPRINQLNTEIYRNLGQYLRTEMELVRIETSTNIIGFDFLTEPKTEEFLKFDKEAVLPFPGYNLFDGEHVGYSATLFEILLNDKIFLEKRQYIQFIDVLGEIGGLMDIIESFLDVVLSFVADEVYEVNIANELFSFNINKKLVTVKFKEKNKKKEENKKDDTLFHSLTVKDNENKDKEEPKLDGIDIYSPDNKTNRKRFSAVTKKKRKRNLGQKKVKIISEALDFLKSAEKADNVEIISNKTNPKEVIKNSKDRIYNTECNNYTDKETGNHGNNIIIDHMNVIDSFISPLFCFCKKHKRYANKILINESMKLISEKLDVINIFQKLWLNEYFYYEPTKNMELIKMSKECSKDLSRINF